MNFIQNESQVAKLMWMNDAVWMTTMIMLKHQSANRDSGSQPYNTSRLAIAYSDNVAATTPL